MLILASSGRFNRSGSICPNSIKKSKFRRLVRAVRFENELNNYYKNSFNLKTRVFFSEENVVIQFRHPRNNEELQQFKKFRI